MSTPGRAHGYLGGLRCYYCCGPLPAQFMHVKRGDVELPVHYGCHGAAVDLLARTTPLIEESPDTFVLPIG